MPSQPADARCVRRTPRPRRGDALGPRGTRSPPAARGRGLGPRNRVSPQPRNGRNPANPANPATPHTWGQSPGLGGGTARVCPRGRGTGRAPRRGRRVSRVCLVSQAARRSPDGLAVFDGRWWTWPELDAAVDSWRGWLSARGLRAGDRLHLLAPNRLELVLAIFAAGRSGRARTSTQHPPHRRRAGETLRRASRPPRARRRDAPRASTGSLATSARGTFVSSDVPACRSGRGRLGRASSPRAPPAHPPVALTAANFDATHAATPSTSPRRRPTAWYLSLPMFHVGALALPPVPPTRVAPW